MNENTYKLYFRHPNGTLGKVIAEGCSSHEEAINMLKVEHNITTTVLVVIK